MYKAEFDLNQLEGFIYHDPETIAAKLGEFAMAGPDAIHIVTDWDRTATANGGGRDITSWGVVQSLLPKEGQEIDRDLYGYYQPKEQASTLTEEEAQEWWRKSLELHVRYETNIRDMRRAVQGVGMRPRDGAVELFELCSQTNVPTVILSAGVKNVIEWVTQEHGMRPTAILATQLHTEEDGRVVGWNEDTLIHNYNKHEMGHSEISAIQRNRPYTVLLGDSEKDPSMVEGDNVVRIQVVDDYPDRETLYLPGYDMVVMNSLLPVVGLMRQLAAERRAA